MLFFFFFFLERADQGLRYEYIMNAVRGATSPESYSVEHVEKGFFFFLFFFTEQQTVRGGRSEAQLTSPDSGPDWCTRTRRVKWAGNG